MQDGEAARWFSQGCDARLAGRPRTACPYDFATSTLPWTRWQAGYRDADTYWGAWVQGRWDYRPLPAVQEESNGQVPRP